MEPACRWLSTGKYSRDESGKNIAGGGRLDTASQRFHKFTDRNWKILDALCVVSQESGHSLGQVALAWALQQPGITPLILGASKLEQLQGNLSTLDVHLAAEHQAKLDQISALELATLTPSSRMR